MAKRTDIKITKRMEELSKELTADGFSNFVTGLGITGRDATKAGRLKWGGIMTEDQAEQIYSSCGLTRRICDKLPSDALQKWIQVKDFDNLQEVKDANRRLDIRRQLKKGLSWGRQYGGAHLFLNTGDPVEQWSEPLDLKRVRELKSLLLLSRWELVVDGADIENDINSDRFGMPRCYRLAPHRVTMPKSGTLARIHYTRLISFHGAQLGLRKWITNGFYHDSIFNGLSDSLTDYLQSNRGVAVALNRFREATHSIKNLAEKSGAGQVRKIVQRINDINAVMSIMGERVLDMDDEKMEFFQNTFAGVPEVLEGLKEALATNTDYPKIVLFQESPVGMSATGNSELEGYYNTVADFQADQVQPALDRYFEVLFAAKSGPTRGQQPEDWSYHFEPLWQATEEEKAKTEFTQAQADDLRIQQGVQDEMDIIERRYPEKADKMTEQDKAAFREALAQEKAARAAQMEAALAEGGGMFGDPKRPKVDPEDDDKNPPKPKGKK